MCAKKTPTAPRQQPPWYGEGLRFQCLQCNACCGGEPGYVWVDRAEIADMADVIGISPEQFAYRYCRRVWWRLSLRERPNGDCIMLTPQGCRVYEARPSQCRTWPFWSDNVDTPQHWEQVRERCPGAGQGRLYSPSEIEQIADGEEET